MKNKKHQHVVPASIIKKFSNDVNDVNTYVANNISRFKFYKNKTTRTFAKKSAYKVIKKDFLDKNLFLVHINNILKPDDKDFCDGVIYSIHINEFKDSVNSYQFTGGESKEFIENYNKFKNLSDYEIRHLLEDSHCVLESSFGLVTQNWDLHRGESLTDEEYSTIIQFLSSNLLRPKSNYHKIEIKDPWYHYNGDIPLYEALNTAKFYDFILNYNYEKISLFDHLTTFNALSSLRFFEQSKKNENIKRLFSYINNNKYNKPKKNNVLLVNNTTNIDFILGDNLVYEYNNKNKIFDDLKKIIGNNFIKKPKKIQIGIIRPDLLIIITDSNVKCKSISLTVDNVKKINSLTVQMADEWLVVKKIEKRNSLIDINFLKKIEKYDYSSSYLKWFKLALEGKILNKGNINFKIINKKDLDKISQINNIAFNFSKIKNIMLLCGASNSYFNLSNNNILFDVESKYIAINAKNNFKIIIYDNDLINDFIKFEDLNTLLKLFDTMLGLKFSFEYNAIFIESKFYGNIIL